MAAETSKDGAVAKVEREIFAAAPPPVDPVAPAAPRPTAA